MREPDDRTLARQVAVHVLGWEYRERFPGDTEGYFGEVIAEELPDFATDMTAAWRLIDYLAARGWRSVCLWSVGIPRDRGGTDWRWMCGLGRGEKDEAEGEGTTPARAICRAGLNAVFWWTDWGTDHGE